MNKFIFLFILFFLFSCSTKKGVYWCGDHPCINKKEKEAYFKKTMIVEIREVNIKSFKKDSESEKLIKQAMINEKNRIKNEKQLEKQEKIDSKNKIKAQKELEKQAKIDEKKRIKNEKKEMQKNKKKDDLIDRSEEIIKELNEEEEELKISKKNNNIASANEFDVLVEKITKRNSIKSFPDINDTP